MVPAPGFIASGGDQNLPAGARQAVQIQTKRRSPAVASGVGAKTQQDDKGLLFLPGNIKKKLDSEHDVVLLEGDGVLADQKKIAQIGSGRFQADNDQFRFRRRTGKKTIWIFGTGGDQRHLRAVAERIRGGDDGMRIFRAQCLVDLGTLVDTSVVQRIDRIRRAKSRARNRLIPDGGDARASIRLA